jgi:hypothetical protein
MGPVGTPIQPLICNLSSPGYCDPAPRCGPLEPLQPLPHTPALLDAPPDLCNQLAGRAVSADGTSERVRFGRLAVDHPFATQLDAARAAEHLGAGAHAIVRTAADPISCPMEGAPVPMEKTLEPGGPMRPVDPGSQFWVFDVSRGAGRLVAPQLWPVDKGHPGMRTATANEVPFVPNPGHLHRTARQARTAGYESFAIQSANRLASSAAGNNATTGWGDRRNIPFDMQQQITAPVPVPVPPWVVPRA